MTDQVGSSQTLRALDWLNFFLADVQTGVGPFVAIYLAGRGWNEAQVGLALTVAGLAGIVTQTPAGALTDAVSSKRALIGVGVAVLAAASLIIGFVPAFWPIMGAQALVGATSSLFIPAICAISLGVVGPIAFDTRQGRNQMFNAAGNVTSAAVLGSIGYLLSQRAVFVGVALLALPTLFTLRLIRSEEIDHDRARGAGPNADHEKPARVRVLFESRPLVVFLVCAVIFHFANAAMLPLVGEMLAKGRGRSSMLFISACVITTQLVVTLISTWSGRKADTWGRKPLLLIAFAVLPVRGLLYTLTDDTALLIAIQVLDGIGVGIFGVVSVLVIADLTRDTGRFNLTLGAVCTAVGIGASLSQIIAGSVVQRWGFSAGFILLAGIATLAFGLVLGWMPETRPAGTR